ncbi:DUF6787 family protein [Marinigracilibium pacificum]|uniref:Diacylglyceryl transferase n=1 Tax=Marinigracilibium pacificum TaxID=2729599 RepID=A0A848IWI9_9BACT|nr:DUF6787 family protein [Marinigracilibium pacificum]NMM48697.1 diacylglyceryl transferase [Marinigracilibium pacificum]
MKWYEKLQKRWNLKSGKQVAIVLIVFALTGSTAVSLKMFILEAAGMGHDTSPWIKFPFVIIMTFMIYQVLLLVYAFIFGQFKFFWEFEKKMFRRFGGKSNKNKKTDE